MFPPSQGFNLNIEAISGICGSISIVCWVAVFSPQIFENFRRGSADGLSLLFIVIWLVGDVFNILGALLQGVLPTMMFLAIYYTFADLALLLQCFYYRGFTLSDASVKPPTNPATSEATERTTLLPPTGQGRTRRWSSVSDIGEELTRSWSNASHLSKAVPLLDAPKDSDAASPANLRPTTALQTTIFNLVSILAVCVAGVLGWWLSGRYQNGTSNDDQPSAGDDDGLQFNALGQIFGYLCAVFYIGSRVPQIILNFKRKSTEGVSVLFFIFVCMGNITYVLSIFAYEPKCHGIDGMCEDGEALQIYGRWILVNFSWLGGTFGTLCLDFAIFFQFFLYSGRDDETSDGQGVRRNDRPLLEHGDSAIF